MNERFIQTKNLYKLLDIEPFIILSALIFLSWFFYRLFLKDASEERHRNLKTHFKNLTRNYILFLTFFIIFSIAEKASGLENVIDRALPYLALIAFAWGAVVFVKVCRLIILQYLFLGSMKAGVPLLIVNIFSLILSVILFVWSSVQIFALQLGPLLATSAAFSVILGLAMQDTLGNLFAGLSLQIDKTFEIGDWLEITQGVQKTVGQVTEISWRATTLLGWTDELIVIPNRTMANSNIANFQSGDIPIVRSQIFRLPYGTDIEKARLILLSTTQKVAGVRILPCPISFASENHESWIGLKVSYWIDNYGSQYAIGHEVLIQGLSELKKANIFVTHPQMQVKVESTT